MHHIAPIILGHKVSCFYNFNGTHTGTQQCEHYHLAKEICMVTHKQNKLLYQNQSYRVYDVTPLEIEITLSSNLNSKTYEIINETSLQKYLLKCYKR